MAIVAHGIDVVEVARVASMLRRHGDRFRQRCYTPGELSYCDAGGRGPEHFAARLAAKEAVMKILGTGWAQGVGWRDIEVLRARSGAPSVLLHGRAAEVAAELGVARLHLSLTHAAGLAVASVVAEGEGPRPG